MPAPTETTAERIEPAARRYMLAVKRLGEQSGYNGLSFFEAPISKMPNDDLGMEAVRRWQELNDAGKALTAECDAARALAPTPAPEPVGPWKSHETRVYTEDGGFDVRGCPNPVALAARIVADHNKAIAQPAAQGVGEVSASDVELVDELANACGSVWSDKAKQARDALIRRLSRQPSAAAPRVEDDPVHIENGQWWYYDETWADKHGPYSDENIARAHLSVYVHLLTYGKIGLARPAAPSPVPDRIATTPGEGE